MNIKHIASALVVGALVVPAVTFAADDGVSTTSKAKTAVKDSVITTKIKAEMVKDKTVSATHIKVDTNDQFQIFGAAQYTLWDQLYLKFIVSHASNHVEDYNRGIYTNTALSGRVRLMLLF